MKLREADDSFAILQGSEVSLRAQLQASINTNTTERVSFELCHSKTQLAYAEAKETVNMQMEEILLSQHRIAVLEKLKNSNRYTIAKEGSERTRLTFTFGSGFVLNHFVLKIFS